jgi:hypothetical protein
MDSRWGPTRQAFVRSRSGISVRVDQLIYLLFFRKTDGERVLSRRKQRALRKIMRGIKLR